MVRSLLFGGLVDESHQRRRAKCYGRITEEEVQLIMSVHADEVRQT